MNFRAASLCIAVSMAGAQAQTGVCSLAGQAADERFDPKMIELVSDPQPIAGAPAFSVQMIARVIGVRPLAVEVLDSDRADLGARQTCEPRLIYSAGSHLEKVLPELRFNDMVKTTMLRAGGGTQPMVLTAVEKISGEPVYFHPRQQGGVCTNRTGTLVSYRQPGGEVTAVYNDGSIYYRDQHGNVFDRQQLGPRELSQLMRAFQRAGFPDMADTPPSLNPAPDKSTVTLICSHRQSVVVPGNEAKLAPLLQGLLVVKAKALAETRYVLKYEEKRAITFLSWPFPQLPIEVAASRIDAAAEEEFEARCAKRPVRGDFHMFHQDLPPAYFHRLPLRYPEHPDADRNRDAYTRSGARIYRVVFLGCSDAEKDCTNLYQLSQLVVEEVLPPEKQVRFVRGEKPAAGSACCVVPGTTRPLPPAAPTGCSGLVGIRSVLWPPGARISLRDVSTSGLPVTNEEYARDEVLYRELLAAARCGGGIDFVEGRYWYRNVRMSREDRAEPPRQQ